MKKILIIILGISLASCSDNKKVTLGSNERETIDVDYDADGLGAAVANNMIENPTQWKRKTDKTSGLSLWISNHTTGMWVIFDTDGIVTINYGNGESGLTVYLVGDDLEDFNIGYQKYLQEKHHDEDAYNKLLMLAR